MATVTLLVVQYHQEPRIPSPTCDSEKMDITTPTQFQLMAVSSGLCGIREEKDWKDKAPRTFTRTSMNKIASFGLRSPKPIKFSRMSVFCKWARSLVYEHHHYRSSVAISSSVRAMSTSFMSSYFNENDQRQSICGSGFFACPICEEFKQITWRYLVMYDWNTYVQSLDWNTFNHLNN